MKNIDNFISTFLSILVLNLIDEKLIGPFISHLQNENSYMKKCLQLFSVLNIFS